MVEHGGRVIQDIAVQLAKRYNRLQRVPKWVLGGNHVRDDKGEGSPAHLQFKLQ